MVEKPFESNGRFQVVQGEEYMKNGRLAFPQDQLPEYVDGFYRTHFGPSVAHTGVTYPKSDESMSKAFTRLSAARQLIDENGDEQLLYGCQPRKSKYANMAERLLHTNQMSFFEEHMRDVEAEQCRLYAPYFNELQDQIEEIRQKAHLPHTKRALRVQCLKELQHTGDIYDEYWSKSILSKPKGEEIAKPGKYPRSIGDLGVAASLQGFVVTNMLKTAQSSAPLHYRDGLIRFIKSPDPEVLKEAFHYLLDPPERYYYIYFSDDACYSVRTSSGIEIYNLDISTCDTSHGPALFRSLEQTTDLWARDQMKKLIKQAAFPVRIMSYTKRSRMVLLKPDAPVLHSGSTITTAINNQANTAIAVAIVVHPHLSPVMAAREAGYNITLSKCEQEEDIQFLKTSPHRDEKRELQPVLNLGVLLRLSGRCKGDLPGRGCLKKRASDFQAALLNGYMTQAKIPMVDKMKERFPLPKRQNEQVHKRVAELYEWKMSTPMRATFTDEAILKRYNLSDVEKRDVQQFFTLGLGYTSGAAGLGRVLEKDYGLTVKPTF